MQSEAAQIPIKNSTYTFIKTIDQYRLLRMLSLTSRNHSDSDLNYI